MTRRHAIERHGAADPAAHEHRSRPAHAPERDVHAEIVTDYSELLARDAEADGNLLHGGTRWLAEHARPRPGDLCDGGRDHGPATEDHSVRARVAARIAPRVQRRTVLHGPGGTLELSHLDPVEVRHEH